MTAEQEIAGPLAILDDYDFELPAAQIAQQPAATREAARLLVVDRSRGEVVEAGPDHCVRSLPDWLEPGDLLVVNSTRVLPARLVGRKSTGGGAEALLLGPAREADAYRALVKCRGRLRVGLELDFGAAAPLVARIASIGERGEVVLAFEPGMDPYGHGHAPLPPYIKRGKGAAGATSAESACEDFVQTDLERYQTVYARTPGAIAAPTAGLHLTNEIFEALRQRGVEIAEVVLHVGAGTFRPLEAEAFETGRLHSEHFDLPEATAEAIARTHAAHGRVIAVGTTTTRVLESRADGHGGVRPGSGETDLFLYPGKAAFAVIDGLLTNFHLPRSSLLLLVAAFVGRDALLRAYATAIGAGHRFYSFGDAMLILPDARRHAHG